MKCLLAIVLCTASYTAMAQQTITPQQAARHIGDSIRVCGKVYGGGYTQDRSNQLTLLYVGEAYPANPFTAVICNQAKALLTKAPEVYYLNTAICFTGRVVLYKGKPQMNITNPIQMSGAINDKLMNEPL